MPLPLGIPRAIIADETYPLRFEKFATELVSKLEGGVHVVVTSSNYDQGRDGISVGSGARVVVCCSLTDEIETKVAHDAKKIAKTTKNFDTLYFCSSQKMTEAAGDKLAAEFTNILSPTTATVVVLSREKLAFFATQHEAVLKTHYPGEVQGALQALADGADSTQLEHSLRLALSVAGTGDAASIRDGVWAAAVRVVLADGVPRTPGLIAARLSNHLKLSLALRTDVVQAHLLEQLGKGDVERDVDGAFVLSALGRANFDDDEERVAASSLEGRAVFRDAIEAALREPITDSQANAMWLALQQSMAQLLYERGREVLAMMAPIFGAQTIDATPTPEADEPKTNRLHHDIVEPLARAAGSVYQLTDQANEVSTAISDLLHSGYGPAVDWLTRSCFAYVCACSLGLETHTQAAIEGLIERTGLVLDTDVVLTLLSADEPSHESVNILRRQWKQYGGDVLVSDEVLHEVAHHAWIADRDLNNVADLWPATSVDRQILSKNAFVRGFGRLLERGEVKIGQWSQWMQQFRGKSATDVTPIRNYLVKDLGFGLLPQCNAESRNLADQVQSYLERKHPKSFTGFEDTRDERIRTDKARRDALLFAALVQAIDQGHERGDGRATYLVSSSGRFGAVHRQFRSEEPGFMFSVPAATYMLAMIPGRSLGLSALRSFLFDGRWQERMSDFQLYALRIVKRSAEFDMPWAKRGQLFRELRGNVESVARDRTGRSKAKREDVQQVEDEWMASNTEEFPRALAQALDRVAADRASDLRVATAEKRVRELEEALAREKRKRS